MKIQSTVTSTPAAIPLLKAGRLRGLGVSSHKRTLAAPDVPTFVEAGIGDIVAENWYGIQQGHCHIELDQVHGTMAERADDRLGLSCCCHAIGKQRRRS